MQVSWILLSIRILFLQSLANLKQISGKAINRGCIARQASEASLNSNDECPYKKKEFSSSGLSK